MTLTHAAYTRQRLTVLSTRYWPDRHGGLEAVMWRLSNALAQTGCSVHVVCENRTSAAGQELIRPGLTVSRHTPLDCGRLWRWRDRLRVRWWRRALRREPTPGWVWANDMLAAAAVIQQGMADRLLYRPLTNAAAARQVADAHPALAACRASAWRLRADRHAYRHAAAVVFESQNLADQYVRWYGPREDACVVHNAAEPASGRPVTKLEARRRLHLPPHAFVIGFVGRFDACKHVEFLLDAVAGAPIRPEHRLLLVGDGPDGPALHGRVDRLGLTDRVVFTGRLEDASPAYAAMDVMVLPSRYETFGNVILEAMAAGRPVIARRRAEGDRPVLVPGEELIADGVTGRVVDAHDPADLGRTLASLSVTPAAVEAMGRAARNTIGRRTWWDVAQDHLRALPGGQSTSALPRRAA